MKADLIDSILSHQKLRKTNLRKKLLAFLVSTKKPQPLSVIKQAVKSVSTDRITLYRELEKLQDLNIIESISLNNSIAYELVDEHHHHAICQSCKKIICLPCQKKEIISLPGWQSLKHQILIKGFCKKCKTKI